MKTLKITYDVKQTPLRIMSGDRSEKTLLLEVALENILPHFVSCCIQMERFSAYSLTSQSGHSQGQSATPFGLFYFGFFLIDLPKSQKQLLNIPLFPQFMAAVTFVLSWIRDTS